MVFYYYLNPQFRGAADVLQGVKSRGGLPFAALATAFSGAILPEMARFVTRRPLTRLWKLLFHSAFFAILGTTVDLLYRGLALLLGSDASFTVVIEKVLIDQFVYSPACSIVMSVLLFAWEGAGFSISGAAESLHNGGFASRYFTLLFTCWAYWIPMLVAVYALPSNLQFVLFLCANGAWSLLLVFISGNHDS